MIISKLIGGLGNQMFQYAIGRAVAHRNSDILKLDISGFATYKLHNGYRLNAFNIDEKIADINEIKCLGKKNRVLRKLAKIGILKKSTFYAEKSENETKFDEKVFLYKDLYLDGYWQNEKYFLDIRDMLIDEFTLKKPVGKNADEYMSIIKNTNSVSVHVRRGDYLVLNGFIGIDYYQNTIKFISQKVQNPAFFIFSDDIKWCKENLNFIDKPIFIENTANELEDLELMKNAKHNIIPNSSFSWWAAWLNANKDKIVIAPKIWFKDRDGFDPVPESWIKI
ncbi:MAG: alpha-1,2-fucosyltransferase [Campylobacteraceae bacterium]|jgi:hypothetical protein|nr:alpha-1,2-fucosyltransferase [Campylobacteraceae bacterium]